MSDNGGRDHACDALFAAYPLAVSDSSEMFLAVPGVIPTFYTLSRGHDGGAYQMWLLPGDGAEQAGGGLIATPRQFEEALRAGVPLPRHWSIFGWVNDGEVSALIVTYTRSMPECPRPAYTVMPRYGTPRASGPPWTGEPCLRQRFWGELAAGEIVHLSPLVSDTRHVVYWCPAETPGANPDGVIAVRVSLPLEPVDWVLRQGVYAFAGSLCEGTGIPELGQLLTGSSKADLGLATGGSR